jgi:hypothetical protein
LLTLAWSVCAQSRPSSEWSVIQRGPHHNVHERTETIDLGRGRIKTQDACVDHHVFLNLQKQAQPANRSTALK